MARIGIICDREFLEQFDPRVYKEAMTLAGAGHEVDVITPHHETGIKVLGKVRVVCCRVTRFPFTTALRLFRAAVRGGYELLHCHEMDPLAYSLILKPLLRCPVVWDCHEYYVPLKRESQGPLAAVLTQLLLSAAAPRVDAIVTVDQRLMRLMERWQHTIVLPNYPREADFPAGKGAGDDAVPRLIYAGSLAQVRGIMETLRAFRRLSDRMEAVLVMAGAFHHRELEAWCYEYVAQHHLPVEWLGWVDHRELAPLLARCHLGLSLLLPLPRYQRAVPTKLYEYMFMGLPVLASQAPPVERLLRRTGCGITVDSTDPDAIAEAMEALLTSPERGQMGERGQQVARRLFTWEAHAGRLLELYAGLLD